MGIPISITQSWRNADLSDVLAALGGVICVHSGEEPDGADQLFFMGRAKSLVSNDQWLSKFDAHNWEQFSSWATTAQGAASVVHLGSLIYGSTWDGGPELAPTLARRVPATFLSILRIIVADIVNRFEEDRALPSLIRNSFPRAFAVLTAVASDIHEVPVEELDNDILFAEIQRLAFDRAGAALVEVWANNLGDGAVAVGARYLKEFHNHFYNGEEAPAVDDIPEDVQAVFQRWMHQMSAN